MRFRSRAPPRAAAIGVRATQRLASARMVALATAGRGDLEELDSLRNRLA